MMSAERNIFSKFQNNTLYIQLKDHESLSFVIGCMSFEYLCPSEISEAEFQAICEEKGWGCVIENGNCHIAGKHHHVDVMANGDVFVDGNIYTVEDQIKRDREEYKKTGRFRSKYARD